MPRETLDRQIQHFKMKCSCWAAWSNRPCWHLLMPSSAGISKPPERIYHDDHLINEKRYAIENAMMILIATQQPMARDLRLMAAILEVITELERMGDYAKGIAKVTMRLGDRPVSIRDA